jgi:hypothetical protein
MLVLLQMELMLRAEGNGMEQHSHYVGINYLFINEVSMLALKFIVMLWFI